MLCQIYQEILKASKTNHSSWKALHLMCTLLARIWWGHSTSFLVYDFVFQVISEKTRKHCVARILQGILERFLYENNCNYNSYKFRYKFDFIPVFSFRRN